MQGNALGRHVLAELFGCRTELLNDREVIRNVMLTAAKKAGAEVVGDFFHQFSPHGISGVVVISESHLAIHTWPEHGYAAVDVFTCGDTVDPWVACRYMVDNFHATNMTANEVRRGIFDQAPARSEVAS